MHTIFNTATEALRDAINRPPRVVGRLPGKGFAAYSPRSPLAEAQADFLVVTRSVWLPLSAQAELGLEASLRELLEEPREH